MREKRNTYWSLTGSPEGKSRQEDLSVKGRRMLKWNAGNTKRPWIGLI